MVYKYYEGTSQIINESIEIGRLLGIVDSTNLQKPKTELRRKNRIKSIQSSLSIEGNTLSIDQVTDIVDNKIVVGSSKEILEVKNAIEVYGSLEKFDPFEEQSYLLAHKKLMNGLIEDAGLYRRKGVGIFKGNEVAHMAPPAWNVHNLMSQLFGYLSNADDNLIIKSCVFHYEMEFIHPFMDGNGRMGRLWQTLILIRHNPVFEFLPIEKAIKDSQEEYYEALSISDRSGVSTKFIEYMLIRIRLSLSELIESQRVNYTDIERIMYFCETQIFREFTRKDYMNVFRNISSATATRDLRKGVELNLFEKEGRNRLSRYKIKK